MTTEYKYVIIHDHADGGWEITDKLEKGYVIDHMIPTNAAVHYILSKKTLDASDEKLRVEDLDPNQDDDLKPAKPAIVDFGPDEPINLDDIPF